MTLPTDTGIDAEINIHTNKPTIIIADRSYGIIPMRYISPPTSPNQTPTTQNTQILLIHQKTRDPYLTYWSFPKGHPEAGDASVLATALRELKEETGLVVGEDGVFVFTGDEGKEKEFKETYVTNGRSRGKQVRFWLGLVEGEQEVKVQAIELAAAEWMSWTEAMERLAYVEAREVLSEVGRALDGLRK